MYRCNALGRSRNGPDSPMGSKGSPLMTTKHPFSKGRSSRILLFSAYIAYNINGFKRRLNYKGQMPAEEITDHVLSQYLDIINLFLDVLRVMDQD